MKTCGTYAIFATIAEVSRMLFAVSFPCTTGGERGCTNWLNITRGLHGLHIVAHCAGNTVVGSTSKAISDNSQKRGYWSTTVFISWSRLWGMCSVTAIDRSEPCRKTEPEVRDHVWVAETQWAGGVRTHPPSHRYRWWGGLRMHTCTCMNFFSTQITPLMFLGLRYISSVV